MNRTERLQVLPDLSYDPISTTVGSREDGVASSSAAMVAGEEEVLERTLSLAEEGGRGEIVTEMVEESGPVVYCDSEEEEEGLGDADIEELAYEGDPLLYSDYEDEGVPNTLTCIYSTIIIIQGFIFTLGVDFSSSITYCQWHFPPNIHVHCVY